MISFNYTTASLAQLKAFADEHGINPLGDRRRLDTWRDAVAQFIEASKPIAAEVARATKDVAISAYAIATSEQAIELYGEIAQLTWYGAKFAAMRFARIVLWLVRLAMWMADKANEGFGMAIEIYEGEPRIYRLACTTSQAAEDSLMFLLGWIEGLGAAAQEEMAIASTALKNAVASANE